MAQKVEYELSLKDLLTGKLREADSAAKGLENTVKNIATTIGAAFAISKIKDFAMSIVDVGSKVENATTGLTTLLGNSAAATKVVNDTMSDAMATPFAFESLLSANKALISAGLSAQSARQDVLNLSNAIAATGGGDDELQRMVVNLQQIKNVGQASALDIKQFAYAGVNIYKVLEEAGIKVEKGNRDVKISYEQITTALQKAHEAGGIYYNGLENMAGNTSVQVSNLGDMMFQLKNQMFQDLKPAITSVIEGLGDFIKWLRDGWSWLVKNRDVIIPLVKTVASMWVAFKGAQILQWVSTLLTATTTAAVSATGATTAFSAATTTALGPVGLLVTALGALAFAYNMAEEAAKALETQRKNNINIAGKQEEESVLSMIEALEKKGVNHEEATNRILNMERDNINKTLRENADFNTSDQNHMLLSQLDVVEGMLKNSKKSGLSRMSDMSSGSSSSERRNKRDVSAKGAVGNRSVTINIKMDNMIKEFKLGVTNITEGTAKVREMVTQAMLSAINDSQIIGNR